VLLEKLIVAKKGKTFSFFMEPEGSLSFSLEPDTGPLPETLESSPQPDVLIFKDPF
jgi:hypothetical protein